MDPFTKAVVGAGAAPVLQANAGLPSLVDEIVVGPASDEDIEFLVQEVLDEMVEEGSGGLEEVYGRSEDEAELGRWFKATEIGNPGDIIRRLGPLAEFRIAKAPNKRFTAMYDSLLGKWQKRRRNQPLPPEKERQANYVIYGATVLTGIRGVKLHATDPNPIKDTVTNRIWLLRKYDPELLNTFADHATNLSNFKSQASNDDTPPDA